MYFLSFFGYVIFCDPVNGLIESCIDPLGESECNGYGRCVETYKGNSTVHHCSCYHEENRPDWMLKSEWNNMGNRLTVKYFVFVVHKLCTSTSFSLIEQH